MPDYGNRNSKANDLLTMLIGAQVEPRRELIEKNALTASNLDV